EPPCVDPRVKNGLRQKGVSYDTYSLVYYSCERRGFVPEPQWPNHCLRKPPMGNLIWNGTPPYCIPHFSPKFWFFWFMIIVLVVLSSSAGAIIASPYKRLFKSGEAGSTEDADVNIQRNVRQSGSKSSGSLTPTRLSGTSKKGGFPVRDGAERRSSSGSPVPAGNEG
ncbi:hypothetical protein EGW08_019557, partial [Elysia chlorotica]